MNLNKISLLVLVLIFFSFAHALSEQYPTDINQSIGSVDRAGAELALSNADLIINQTIAQNISFVYAQDLLTNAKRIFTQVEYVDVLRNIGNYSYGERVQAIDALRLVDWKNISYGDVVLISEGIKLRQKQAYFLVDKLSVAEKDLANANFASDKSKNLSIAVKTAFIEERYNDTNQLLNEFRASLEQDKTNSAGAYVISESAKSIFVKYPLQSIIVLILIVLIVVSVVRRIRIVNLRKKIERMHIEKGVLHSLMKRAQDERFNKGIISEMVYKIRTDNYSKKIEKMKQELPVLEAKYRELTGNKGAIR